MNQSENKGSRVRVIKRRVTPQQVLTDKRFKLVGVKLTDWVGCFDCRTQQSKHAFNGADIPGRCWSCGSTNLGYMDEVARDGDQYLFRLVRP